jgi:beta-glucosidase
MMPKATFCFPRDFRWGTATSSHQVEGNNTNNDWWAWEQQPGRIVHDGRSGRACNWWEDAERDLSQAAALGTNAHRLSIEWSRVEPRPGVFDRNALDRYRQILQSLHERSIEPMVTLHHFSNPIWLAEAGGWAQETVVNAFERYVRKVVEHLGDLVPLWITINEPMVYATLAYLAVDRSFPPGKNSPRLVAQVVRHMLMAHAAAYHAIHELRSNCQVGIARAVRVFKPARPRSLLDKWATRKLSAVYNDALNQALITGKLRPPLGRGRLRGLAHTFDFIGLSYRTRERVGFGIRRAIQLLAQRPSIPGAEASENDSGDTDPQGLLEAIKLATVFGRPIYITRSGIPDEDDHQRPRFLLTHLRRVWAAIQFNIPVMGYYYWSLIDSFEWNQGWRERYGLIGLDVTNQDRNLRLSGELYGRICRSGCIDWETVAEYTPDLLDEMFPG